MSFMGTLESGILQGVHIVLDAGSHLFQAPANAAPPETTITVTTAGSLTANPATWGAGNTPWIKSETVDGVTIQKIHVPYRVGCKVILRVPEKTIQKIQFVDGSNNNTAFPAGVSGKTKSDGTYVLEVTKDKTLGGSAASPLSFNITYLEGKESRVIDPQIYNDGSG